MVHVLALPVANKASAGMKNVVNSVISGLSGLTAQVASIGNNIVQGIWNGISGVTSWIVNKVKSFAKGILDGMKAALGIHSPSKVFEDEVGKNLALGIGEGFSDEMKEIQKEMLSVIPTNFETDINAGINPIKTPTAGLPNETKAGGFNIYMKKYEFILNNNNASLNFYAIYYII